MKDVISRLQCETRDVDLRVVDFLLNTAFNPPSRPPMTLQYPEQHTHVSLKPFTKEFLAQKDDLLQYKAIL